MDSGRGMECLTMAPYRPYSAITVLRPQHFSFFLHLARRFWNHTCADNTGGSTKRGRPGELPGSGFNGGEGRSSQLRGLNPAVWEKKVEENPPRRTSKPELESNPQPWNQELTSNYCR